MEPAVTVAQDFDAKINISLRRDEAIVLYWYLSREILMHGEARLRSSYENEAESHGLNALLQELIKHLMDTGGPDSETIHAAAVAHLMKRFE
jgi:hypothetical protein